MIGLFLDLTKAFDILDHKILLSKLYDYGIRGILLKWFEHYLTNRKQYVHFGNVITFATYYMWSASGVYVGSPFIYNVH